CPMRRNRSPRRHPTPRLPSCRRSSWAAWSHCGWWCTTTTARGPSPVGRLIRPSTSSPCTPSTCSGGSATTSSTFAACSWASSLNVTSQVMSGSSRRMRRWS
ncbi:MAG: hypothetical protein AVDCRST_MAG57-311, partial [uncultured Blastococcus sp.]